MAAWQLLTPEKIQAFHGAFSDDERLELLAEHLNVAYPGMHTERLLAHANL